MKGSKTLSNLEESFLDLTAAILTLANKSAAYTILDTFKFFQRELREAKRTVALSEDQEPEQEDEQISTGPYKFVDLKED